jgi:hypothetical protein
MTPLIGLNGSTIASVKDDRGSKWAKEMQAHFARTGRYRPEDIKRVLGSPLHGIALGTNLETTPAGK